MKKLKLEIDSLRVESFDAALPQPVGGTVHGNENAAASGNSVYRPCFYTEQPSCTC
ncbi:hypothetical protein [Longimicrobium sp.]|uniref:hypothetical protein n=1 Tax=Longimicrobium sp. TaxID=2029185 RepID=UPI003B3AA981